MFRQDTRKWNQIQFKILVMVASESVENAYHSVVMDAIGPYFNPNEIYDELPNPVIIGC